MRESMANARSNPRFYFFKPTDDMTKDRDTFIVQLTVGELIEIIREAFPVLQNPEEEASQVDGPNYSGRLVYGLRGIQDLFHVSHKTAQSWKDTWLAPAVRQYGRKIVTDADYAFRLFDRREVVTELNITRRSQRK